MRKLISLIIIITLLAGLGAGAAAAGNPAGNSAGNSTGNSAGNPASNLAGNPAGNSGDNSAGNPAGNSAGNPAGIAALSKAVSDAVSDAAAYILKTVQNPVVDPVGGEWAVFGLARSGYDVSDSYYEGYYRTVEKYVREHGAILHDRKYTDNSRVILALTAAGYDPRSVAGCDLTMALGDFEKTIWQGVNGPVFALLALDSMNYPMPVNPDAKTQATREMYLAEILRRQLDDGGWNLASQPSDPDLTGMALQALAKYQHIPEVKAATDRALARVSEIQDDKGGFSGWGNDNIESTVQVLVALGELGISFEDPRFVKNGKSTVDNILSYRNSDGSYRHTSGVGGNNQMSSEQALYGLVAAQRFLCNEELKAISEAPAGAGAPGNTEPSANSEETPGAGPAGPSPDAQAAQPGRNSLYRMGDAVLRGEFLPVEQALQPGAGLPGKDLDVCSVPVTAPGKTFPDIAAHPNKAAIVALSERGIITGKSDLSFDPDATMTRAEFAAIIVRGLGLDVSGEEAAVNRQSAGEPCVAFTDVAPGSWYSRAVGTAYSYGVVNGTSETTFNPGGTITRQEAALMITRAAKLCGMEVERGETETRDTLALFGDYRSKALRYGS